jgi:hypothetical protein
MKKWEYKYVKSDYIDNHRHDLTEYLNTMGEEGWELVTCTVHDSGYAGDSTHIENLVFKRKIEKAVKKSDITLC